MNYVVEALLSGLGIFALVSFVVWCLFFLKGRQFALRDRLRQGDAIVVLAGTRGNINFLHGKVDTAIRLYQQNWAPYLICSGKFSVKVTHTPTLIPLPELEAAAANGRLHEKDVVRATTTWDSGLGATYMREQALRRGVPAEAVLVESESLHTRENAEMVLAILKQYHMQRIILVTSPFHQRRTYLTFAKVFQPHGIDIVNYYAETGEWHPATWFLSSEHRQLVQSEEQRIKHYREKGDLL